MRIINHSGYFDYELTVNGNKVGPNQEIIVGEMMFNSQDIFSDIGSVEIITEYGKRTFRCYGSLKAYESKDLKDANGSAAILIINTIPQLHYKGENKKIESIDAYMNEGIVESEHGDLIGRSGLINAKPEFMNEKVIRDTKYRTTKDRIYARAWNACNTYWLDTIINAPTVEPERPKGEWIFKTFDEETGIANSDWCPFCGTVKAQVYDNFCSNCGADLQKGDAE